MLRPYPALRQWQGSHLTLLHGRGKVPLSLCTYKYRKGFFFLSGGGRDREKENGEKERRDGLRGEETRPNRGRKTKKNKEDFGREERTRNRGKRGKNRGSFFRREKPKQRERREKNSGENKRGPGVLSS
jgi:hypothetical protein